MRASGSLASDTECLCCALHWGEYPVGTGFVANPSARAFDHEKQSPCGFSTCWSNHDQSGIIHRTFDRFSAVSAAEKQAVSKRVTWWHQLDPHNQQAVPVDLVTGSAGGTDPYISLAGANYQRQRVARANHLSLATVNQLIAAQTTSVFANWFGEPAVNVVTLNIALQQLVAQTK